MLGPATTLMTLAGAAALGVGCAHVVGSGSAARNEDVRVRRR